MQSLNPIHSYKSHLCIPWSPKWDQVLYEANIPLYAYTRGHCLTDILRAIQVQISYMYRYIYKKFLCILRNKCKLERRPQSNKNRHFCMVPLHKTECHKERPIIRNSKSGKVAYIQCIDTKIVFHTWTSRVHRVLIREFFICPDCGLVRACRDKHFLKKKNIFLPVLTKLQ